MKYPSRRIRLNASCGESNARSVSGSRTQAWACGTHKVGGDAWRSPPVVTGLPIGSEKGPAHESCLLLKPNHGTSRDLALARHRANVADGLHLMARPYAWIRA